MGLQGKLDLAAAAAQLFFLSVSFFFFFLFCGTIRRGSQAGCAWGE
jgi:hypothetical protein